MTDGSYGAGGADPLARRTAPGASTRAVRRAAARLRGWGGVAAMAVACGLTASLTLLPLAHGGGAAAVPGAPVSGPGVGTGIQVKADTCRDPEASLRPSTADGPTLRAIRKRGKLIVGVDQSSYLWGYRNPETQTLQGFDIDLAKAIAKDILGDENAVILRAVPTNQRVAALDNGKVDLVVRTMTVNCRRIQQVAFSTAYFETGQQVLAHKLDRGITGHDASLRGKRVCTAESSTAYEALEENAFGAVFKDPGDGTKDDEDLLTVPNQLDCLARLQLGEVDAVVTDSALAAGQAAQDPAVELKGTRFTKEYYAVAAKLGNDDLVRRVNKVLEGYRKGPWQKAYQKWLEAVLPGMTAPPAPLYK
ncbi:MULTISPECIES: glutamate ABC transporter substrate-binding protein [unclassified Streptomyces]|jgi:polar amino acid transport system substrate-binding protein|uniref:glutamate ABC transporter substrate-binding protein n=1 Tax=unclassified Streptomyces TaxID=2593676 RepID=UPI00369C7FD2